MADKQNMMQAITQAIIKAANGAIMTVKEPDNQINTARLVQVCPEQLAKY